MITEEQAKQIAHQECENQGYPYREPLRIDFISDFLRVTTNAHARGGNVRVDIDKETGEVLSSSFAPR